MRWVLLLRGVNVGGNNTVPMTQLVALLEDAGHRDVRTHLNSGNATFTSSRRSASALARQVEQELLRRLAVRVRACVRSDAEVRQALDALPDLPGYVVLNVLLDRPDPQALQAFLATDWSPEVVQGDDRVLYCGFRDAARTALTNARIERALGVACTARTPATLARLLA